MGPSNRLISASGGNFENMADKTFMGRFLCCNFLTVGMLPNKINKIPTNTRNQTVRGTLMTPYPCVRCFRVSEPEADCWLLLDVREGPRCNSKCIIGLFETGRAFFPPS